MFANVARRDVTNTFAAEIVGTHLEMSGAVVSGGTDLLATTGLFDPDDGGVYVQRQENAGSAARVMVYSAGTVQSQMIGGKAGGTLAAPTATPTGDILDVYATTYTGSAWAYPAYMKFRSVETHSPTAQGTEIEVGTTPIGSNVSQSRFRWTHDGHYVPVITGVSDLGATAAKFRDGHFSGEVLDAGGGVRKPRVQNVAAHDATLTPTFSDDMLHASAQTAAFQFVNPTGTAIPGMGMVLRTKANGAYAITYDTQYRAIGAALPSVSVANKWMLWSMVYNSTDTKWDIVYVGVEQ